MKRTTGARGVPTDMATRARLPSPARRARILLAGVVAFASFASGATDLAFPGLAREEPAFNAFFAQVANDAPETAVARSLLLAWKGPGVPVVVTHQVNITALTGIVPGFRRRRRRRTRR